MHQTANLQKLGTKNEAREQLKRQLAQHLAQQPESTLAAHKWMKRLEVAGAGLILAAFITALSVSIAWKSVPPTVIPVAWFLFAASAAPAMICLGLDAIIVRAFPSVAFPGISSKFVTGSGAAWLGLGCILLALAVAAFWGLFAYAVGTLNLALISPLATSLGVLMSLGIIIQLIYTTYKKLSKA